MIDEELISYAYKLGLPHYLIVELIFEIESTSYPGRELGLPPEDYTLIFGVSPDELKASANKKFRQVIDEMAYEMAYELYIKPLEPYTKKSARFKLIETELLNITKSNSNIDDSCYLSSLKEDLDNLLTHLFVISRHSEPTELTHKLYFQSENDLTFDATISIKNQNEVVSKISYGLLLAIDDLFFRLAANQDFFSFGFNDGKHQFDGCQCRWFDVAEDIPHPFIRYFSYEHQKDNLFPRPNASFLTRFYSVIPLDGQRLQLANFMTNIALLWIMMHEEAHYCRGHVLYMQEIGLRSSSGSLGISETKNHTTEKSATNDSSRIRKIFESQADQSGARAVIDIFFRDKYCDLLPGYCVEDKALWLLRLIIVTMASEILIFQKANLIYGSHNEYPSTKTRLISVIVAAFQRALDPSFYGYQLLKSVDQYSLYKCVVRIIDDLYTAASLMNKEGKVIKWGTPGGKAPEIATIFKGFDKNGSLIEQDLVFGILDKEEDIGALSDMIFTGIIKVPIPQHPDNPHEVRLYLDWFAESMSLSGSDDEINEMLKPYRYAVGMSE